VYKRYRRDSGAYQGVFGVGLLNDIRQILPQPTHVAMATKFETKQAITRVYAWDISEILQAAGGFGGWANE